MIADTITLGSILGILTVLGGVATLLMHGRKVRRENEADARGRNDELKAEIGKHNDGVERRLLLIEDKTQHFMPRTEIERAIEHEKTNRQMADQSLKEQQDRTARDVIDIKVSLGKVEQKQGDLASDMTEIKALVKDQGRDLGAKIDKLADVLAARRAS